MIILFHFLLLLSGTASHHLQNDFIEWSSDRRLSWDDFMGTPDSTSPNVALTNASIKADFGYNQKGFEYSIHCRFDKTKSWVKIKNDYILSHEQGHFDITEIYARKLNKALKEYNFNSQSAEDDLNKIYENIVQQHHQLQEQYDKETDYSRNLEKQQEWLIKIHRTLNSLQQYADYH